MEVRDRHVVVTGGAGGIGRALVRRFAAEGAGAVVAADRDLDGARAVAGEVGGQAVELDAGSENSVRALVAQATDAGGPIDIFISNAGVPGAMGGPEAPDESFDEAMLVLPSGSECWIPPEESWEEAWRVNVMAHVWAARGLLPHMLERGEGYLLNTASAAGLLTQVSSLIYSVTKHAAVALAEWLAIEYGDRGIRVSCICPQGVRTPMLDLAMEEPAGAAALTSGGLIEPEDVAEAVVAGIREERMLILPHENVAGFMALKGSAPERWVEGMRRMVREARSATAG